MHGVRTMIVPKGGYAQGAPHERQAGQMSDSAEIRGKEESLISRVRAFFGSGSEGGALVEFAVTLPVVLLLITGIFTFSIALFQKLLLAKLGATAGTFWQWRGVITTRARKQPRRFTNQPRPGSLNRASL